MGLFRRSKKNPSPDDPPSKVGHCESSIPSPPQISPPQYHPRDGLYQTPIPGQPAGFLPPPPLPAPPGWNNTLPPGSVPPPQYHDQRPYPPIVVNQHYYLGPPALPPPPANPYPHSNGACAASRLKLGSVVNLASEMIPGNLGPQIFDDGLPRWHGYGTQLLNQGAAMYDQIYSSLNNVITLVDRDKYIGNENDLFMYQSNPVPSPPIEPSQQIVVHKGTSKKSHKKESTKETSKAQTSAIASSLASRGYFAKVELYANSKLPPNLPPLRLYIPTYPLICLAAKYSERVYENPRGAERDAHVDADWRTGAKAMRIKSVPMDHMGTIVFAVRGTATFMDWSVNLNTAPTAPTGFLDDPNNFCHAGFLSVARKMISPVAARLRHLIEEDPRRCSYSLLITGHSAGGAVASLLYAHMLSTSKAASSELNHLTGCFKRVHCITFGTPPVSLYPLQKPPKSELKKFIFLTFINEGDPVARADKAYVKSLLELFVAPAPAEESKASSKHLPPPKSPSSKHSKRHGNNSSGSLASKTSKTSMKSGRSSSHSSSKSSKSKSPGPIWKVPPSTLSNAGQIVVLRTGDSNSKPRRAKTVEERLGEGVIAQVATDEQLRGLIWGDPVCHVMKLYIGRVERLAVEAVTAKGH